MYLDPYFFKTKKAKSHPFEILKQLLFLSCVWLFLACAATAQTLPTSSSSDNQGAKFTSLREGNAVPGASSEYERIDTKTMSEWFVRSTIGPTSLVGGVFAAALGTSIDAPSEYGPHWEGFAKRYGMRLTGISTGNAMEATLGLAWGEDPRYFHTIDSPFGERVRNVVDLTFRAYQPDGERHLAFARYTAIAGNNFLSNAWRAPSEADWQHALLRTAEGFGARALSNTFKEFAPEVLRKIHRKQNALPSEDRRPL